MVTSRSDDLAAQATPRLLWLLLLPALILSWPSPNPIAGDFASTETTTVGLAALLLTPLCLWLLIKRPLPFRGVLALFAALALAASFGTPTDSLSADRAFLTFLVGALVATGASALDESGLRGLLRGLSVVSLMLIVPGLFDGNAGWGGVLGNSGELSGAALPGAMCGLHLWARETGKWRWVGMCAIGLLLLHALLAPVLATLAVLALICSLVAWLAKPRIGTEAVHGVRAKVLSVCVLTILGAGWIAMKSRTEVFEGQPATAVQGPDAAPTQLGGFEVRWRIWQASLPMVLEHPLTGVGSGQFAARFPEHRDPVERELSNWNYRIEQSTEVENPHNDWLLPWVEGGVLMGLAWWLFLGMLIAASIKALREETGPRAALAMGVLATVTGALLNAPLLYNPIASLSSFLLFGALMGPLRRAPRRAPRKWSASSLLTPGLTLLMLLFLPRAFGMWRHGVAIASLAESASVTDQSISVEAALDACPDSVIALSLQGRIRAVQGEGLEDALGSWNQVLALRPQRFEAWMQVGVLQARLGRLDEAREAFARAVELDSGHPALARNRVRCFAESHMLEAALVELERLEELGHGDKLWLLDLSCELLLRGFVEEARSLLEEVDERFLELSGEGAWALEADYRRGGNRKTADAFRSLAYVTWGREQAQSEQWPDARRSYFQALRIMRDYVPPAGPLAIRLEHAASLWHGDRQSEAREELVDLKSEELNWARLFPWVREALFELGVDKQDSAAPSEAQPEDQ